MSDDSIMTRGDDSRLSRIEAKLDRLCRAIEGGDDGPERGLRWRVTQNEVSVAEMKRSADRWRNWSIGVITPSVIIIFQRAVEWVKGGP